MRVIPSAERDLAESHANIFLQSPCAGLSPFGNSSGELKFPSSQPTLSYRVGALLEMTETQMFFLFVNTMKLMTQNHAS